MSKAIFLSVKLKISLLFASFCRGSCHPFICETHASTSPTFASTYFAFQTEGLLQHMHTSGYIHTLLLDYYPSGTPNKECDSSTHVTHQRDLTHTHTSIQAHEHTKVKEEKHDPTCAWLQWKTSDAPLHIGSRKRC